MTLTVLQIHEITTLKGVGEQVLMKAKLEIFVPISHSFSLSLLVSQSPCKDIGRLENSSLETQ